MRDRALEMSRTARQLRCWRGVKPNDVLEVAGNCLMRKVRIAAILIDCNKTSGRWCVAESIFTAGECLSSFVATSSALRAASCLLYVISADHYFVWVAYTYPLLSFTIVPLVAPCANDHAGLIMLRHAQCIP